MNRQSEHNKPTFVSIMSSNLSRIFDKFLSLICSPLLVDGELIYKGRGEQVSQVTHQK